MVGDLVDDSMADLVSDLLLAVAGRADRLAVDGDAIGQDSRVLRRAAGERDALVEPEQAGRARLVLDRHRDIAHELAELLGKPDQRRDDDVLETAGFDLGHQPIVHRSAAARSSPAAAGPPADRRTRPVCGM